MTDTRLPKNVMGQYIGDLCWREIAPSHHCRLPKQHTGGCSCCAESSTPAGAA